MLQKNNTRRISLFRCWHFKLKKASADDKFTIGFEMKKLNLLLALCAIPALAVPLSRPGKLKNAPSVVKVSASITAASVFNIQDHDDPAQSEWALMGIGGNITTVISGKKDHMNFGAIAAIDLDRLKDSTKRVPEVYGYLANQFGNFFVGCLEGPSTTFMYDAFDVIGSGKGPGGNMGRAVHLPIGVDLYSGMRLGPKNQIVFTTASMGGVRFGISYAPDTSEVGRPVRGMEKNSIDKKFSQRNVVETALNFTKSAKNGTTFGVYLSGVFGKALGARKEFGAAMPKYKPIKEFQVGVLLDFGALRLAGGYMDLGTSGIREGLDHTAPKGFNIGFGYTIGPFMLSGGFFHTTRKVTDGDAKSYVTSAGIDYCLAPGVIAYFEFDYLKAQSTEAHCSEGAVDHSLDLMYDSGGYSKENGGPVETTAKVLILGLKIQC